MVFLDGTVGAGGHAEKIGSTFNWSLLRQRLFSGPDWAVTSSAWRLRQTEIIDMVRRTQDPAMTRSPSEIAVKSDAGEPLFSAARDIPWR